MKWLFDNASKVAALFSFALIAVTTIHDWGYFLVVGFKFRQIQTTYDYIASGIEWLPAMIVTLSVGYLWFWVSNRLITRRPTNLGFGDHERVYYRRILIVGVIAFAANSMFSLARGLLNSFPYNLYNFSVSAGCAFVAASGVAYLWSRQRGTFQLWLGLAAVALVFTFGVLDGDSAINGYYDVYAIKTKDETDKRLVSLLRSFEKGLLIRNPANNQIQFVRWETVEILSKTTAPGKTTIACAIFSLFCKPQFSP